MPVNKFFFVTVNKLRGHEVEDCVTTNYETMKKLITAIALSVFAFAGTAIHADAHCDGGDGYNVPARSVYVSGYRYGRPVYTERYFVGYDEFGNPRFAYRTISEPVRSYPQHCDSHYSDYGNSRGNPSYGGYNSGYYEDRRSSGVRVSFSFGR